MDIVEFIFMLLQKFSPMDTGKRMQLQAKASKWYAELINGKPTGETGVMSEVGFVGQFLKKWGEEWYIQTLLAILFIPACAWIDGFMNGTTDDTKV